MTGFGEYVAARMENPEFRSAYEHAQERSALREALVARRKAAGLKQAEIARRMGIKQATVSEFEDDSADPWLSSLQRYAWAVGCKIVVSIEDVPK